MKNLIYCFLAIFVILSLNGCTNTSTNAVAEPEIDADSQQKSEELELPKKEPIPEKILLFEDFWNLEGEEEGATLTFATGLEIVFPENWSKKVMLNKDLGPINQPFSNRLIVCEKENAKANAGGVLFSLGFYLHEDSTYEIFQVDTVLGIYRQGDKEYALICEMPREMNYVEGNEDMKQAYEKLSSFVDEVQINTKNMPGFTECAIDDFDWIKYQ